MKQIPGCDRCKHRAESLIKEFCNNPKSVFYKRSPIPNQKACVNANLKKEKEALSVRGRMKRNIMAYNKNITRAYLKGKTPLELLHLVHELDRREFSIQLSKAKLITTEEARAFLRS